jgi:succinate-semialdehyde dehydrogenase/glutarate-semialdehyde dehydrogenase
MSLESAYPYDLFINGSWSPSLSSTRIDVTDPSTGVTIASVADAMVKDGLRAVDAADAAAADWAATSPRKRSDILRRCFDLMMRDSEKLARLISLENGKALRDARGEVLYAAEFFRWFSEEAVRNFGDMARAPSGNNQIIVKYEPIGISLLITPWNFPAAMATRKLAPALAAGCTCVLKPATETPLTAYAIAALMSEAGVPDGVVNVLTTSTTSTLVNALLDDSRIRKVSFTGSTEIGRVLLRKAADRVISCSMELGGNAPLIVFDDADLDNAIDGTMIAKMRNGGEACTAANRIFVQSGIYDRFVAALGARMDALKVGPGVEEGTECGPLVNAASVRKVASLVDDAIAKGARLICGGQSPKGAGHYYLPTVLADLTPEAEVTRAEIFGPVAPIFRFDTEAEVIARANDTEYGLVAYVFTKDLARGLRVCDRLDAGMIALNRGIVSDPAAPFGGVKQSGLGREGGHHGMLEFMEAKYIATDWSA